ncbi:MAG: hypothetical protein V2I43_17000 [Parvularcula sp.]|jgi:hypothetical protein|nr:hypothetical protein [Parvularcula sp.]
MRRNPHPRQRIIETECTVTVRHTEETLEAHVDLDNGLLPGIGDKVTVFGDPVRVEYGNTLQIRRAARLVRGSLLDKLWIRFLSLFEITELYEVSFSPRRF